MNALSINSLLKRVSSILPEIWYILLFGSLVYSNLHCLYTASWSTGNTVTTLLSTSIIVLLIIQLFRQNSWSSLLLGMLFTVGSFIMVLAVIFEYHEFPEGNEPNAIKLIFGGIFIVGTSLVLGGLMLTRGIRRIYA